MIFKKIIKWFLYFLSVIVVLTVILFSIAYWNSDKILGKINAQLSESINGEFGIRTLSFTMFHRFPDFSITLNDVYLKDSLRSTAQDFFTAKKIVLDISFVRLFQKKVDVQILTVQDAKLFVYRSVDGYSNQSILKKPANDQDSTSQPFLFSIGSVALKNVSLDYEDSLANKSYRFQFLKTLQKIRTSDSVSAVRITGSMHFDGLNFNPESGSYLSNKFAQVDIDLEMDKRSKLLMIKPSSLRFDKAQIEMTGNALMKPEGNFYLQFESTQLDVAEGKTLVNKRLALSLEKIEVKKAVQIKATIHGRFIPGYKPDVDVVFSGASTEASFGKALFSNFSFNGSFINHVDSALINDPANSKLTISSFKGRMNEFPVEGSVAVIRLNDPFIDLSVKTIMKLKELNEHIDTTRFKFLLGKLVTELKYKGPLDEYLNVTKNKFQGNLTGKTMVEDGSFYYAPRQLSLEKINANSDFNQQKVTINELNFNLNGSPVKMRGTIQNFVPFFYEPQNTGYIQMAISSPAFDMGAFISKKPKENKTNRQIRQEKKKVSDMLDSIFDRLEFDLDVTVKKLTLKKFEATNFSGRLSLFRNTLQAKPVNMKVAGGQMSLEMKILNLNNKINPITANVKVTDASIDEFFVNFSNFNQKVIVSENLLGTITANVKFSANVDDQLVVSAPSMKGSVDCKIKNGRLIDFEPLLNVGNFLFKKRDFSDVKFAEINSHFDLQGTDMDISRMEIQSSVLSLFLQGRYSFTDSTSLSVQLPLSNLKKRDKDYKPENIGINTKTGMSVYLHVYRDKDGKIAMAYDPFKKWVKSDK
jgi:uncharacterized protein involved in outer membrane biogenesis